MGEEDLVSVSGRVDADVVLGVGRVREEGLDDEGVERSSRLLHLNGLASSGRNPLLDLLPALVEAEQAGLSSSLDELVGLRDELLGEDPVGETGSRGDGRSEGVGSGVPENAGSDSKVSLESKEVHLDCDDGTRREDWGDGVKKARREMEGKPSDPPPSSASARRDLYRATQKTLVARLEVRVAGTGLGCRS